MSFLRSSTLVRSFAATAPRVPIAHSAFTYQQRLYAQQSYGSGEGDPKGENPQEQGANPSADKEHPGPPPPDVGKGSGGGPTKAGGDGRQAQNTEQKSSSGGSGSGGTGRTASGDKGGAQPKILDESGPPAEPSEEVKKHNEEMDQRYEKAESRVNDEGKDNVGKGWWKGEFGLFT